MRKNREIELRFTLNNSKYFNNWLENNSIFIEEKNQKDYYYQNTTDRLKRKTKVTVFLSCA